MAIHEHERTVVWAPNATWMLDDAISTLASVPLAAQNFLEDVLRAVDVLERYADDGDVVPELGRVDVREIHVGRYRLQYHVSPDTASIVAIAHEPSSR